MAYDRKQYAVAIPMLLEEYERSNRQEDKSRKAYYLAKSYSLQGDTKESITWYEKAKAYGNQASLDLAYAYKKNKNYRKAIQLFNQLAADLPSRQQELKREAGVCEQIALWSLPDTIEYDIRRHRLSGSDMDYAPVMYEDNFLVFTSDREEAKGEDIYNWTGAGYSDLFVTPLRGGSVRKFDAIINSEHNDGAACFSSDYQEMYFTRCYSDAEDKDAYCKLMSSIRVDGTWTEPYELNFMVDGYNYGQPALIEQDSVLVFSSDLEGAIGGHDLFYSEKVPTSNGGHYWSEPYPFPRTINTQGEEMFPTASGDTLFFSSDFHAGYGGLDIFYSRLVNGKWTVPVNMLAPINSSEDDFALVVDKTALKRGNTLEVGYFTSTRDGLGYEDIYRYSKLKTTPVIEEDDPVEEQDSSLYIVNLAVKTLGIENGQKSTLSNVRITLTDGSETIQAQSDNNGRYIVEVKRNKTYTIKGSKSDYLVDQKTASSKGLTFEEGELGKTINATLELQKIDYGSEITLDNIYYDFDKWELRDESKPALDSLALLLKNNPAIEIELMSHTDCQGEDNYNMILSQKRAQSVVDYVVSKGVSLSRLIARGYGETALIDTCPCEECTEEQHQKNRRTTFRMLRE